MRIICFAIAVIAYTVSNAQDSKIYVVNPGQTIQEVIPDSIRYTNASFQHAKVLFMNGNVADALMNYNLMLQEMQFIDPAKGDTLSLADPDKLSVIVLGNDSFYYNKGYLKQISQLNHVRLLQKQTIRLSSRNTLGVFDQPAQGAATTYSSFVGNTHDVNLRVNEKLTFKKETHYYLLDKNKNIYPLSLSNLQMLLPRQRSLLGTTFQNKNLNDPHVVQQLSEWLNSQN
ncbi:MAG TPA: hypothetical protein VGC75_05115 [Candidatus Nitrosocosmicus sp.]